MRGKKSEKSVAICCQKAGKMWQEIQGLEWATHRWPCTFQQRRSAKPIGVAVWPSSIDTAPLVRQSTLFHGPSLKNGTFSCASAFHLSVVVFFLAFTERCIGQLCHHTAVSCAVGNRSHAGPVSCLDFQPTRMRQNKKKAKSPRHLNQNQFSHWP